VTIEVAPRGPRSPIRLRPVPQYEPPFDDEREPERWASPHQMVLDWSVPTAPALPEEASAVAAATLDESFDGDCETPGAGGDGQPRGGDGQSGGDDGRLEGGHSHHAGVRDGGQVRRGCADQGSGAYASASGDAKLAVRRFVSACVEVLNGYRPAVHLRRLSLPVEAARIVAQGAAGAQRVAEVRRAVPGRVVPRARRPAPVAVLRLRVCQPRPGAAEASVVLVTGERAWAMALRLELHEQSWMATTLRLI
jgi:hypothetical protein